MLALVTCAAAASADTDMPMLTDQLSKLGVRNAVVSWDDPTVDWSGFELAILRSTWDYFDRYAEFMSWARATARITRLMNPIDVIEWNTDKRYLAELHAEGIPIVPSEFVHQGERLPESIGADVVVKPTVGAGSNRVRRFRNDPAGVAEHVDALHRQGFVALVQPYLPAIDHEGETGLVYLNGTFSHAFGKSPILAGDVVFSAGIFADERIVARTASAAQRQLADTATSRFPSLAYARVDLLPGPDGPVVLELELTEPSLFLDTDPGAAARAAAAFRSLMA